MTDRSCARSSDDAGLPSADGPRVAAPGKVLMPNDIPRPIDPIAVKTAERQMLTPRNEKRMSALLEALCDPARIKIVRALRDTTLAASDLAHVIGRSRTATSQHLRVLRELGAVTGQRTGNVVRYTLSTDLPGSVIEEAASAFDKLQPGTAATGR